MRPFAEQRTSSTLICSRQLQKENTMSKQNLNKMAIACIDRVCQRTHHSNRTQHQALEIPGRNDACFIFCTGFGNRIFLVQIGKKKIVRELAGANDGYEIIPDLKSVRLDGTIVELYCGARNFVGASRGATLRYDLGAHRFRRLTSITKKIELDTSKLRL